MTSLRKIIGGGLIGMLFVLLAGGLCLGLPPASASTDSSVSGTEKMPMTHQSGGGADHTDIPVSAPTNAPSVCVTDCVSDVLQTIGIKKLILDIGSHFSASLVGQFPVLAVASTVDAVVFSDTPLPIRDSLSAVFKKE